MSVILAMDELGRIAGASPPPKIADSSKANANKTGPTELPRPAVTAQVKHGRGRKPGPYGTYNKRSHRRDPSAGASTAVKPPTPARMATETLVMLHEFMALLPGFDAMRLDAGEQRTIEKAVQQFLTAYPEFSVSPKITAWCTLAGAGAVIYGPRFLLIREELRVRRAKRVRNVESPPSPAGNPDTHRG